METNLRIFLSLPRQLLMRVLVFNTNALAEIHYITLQERSCISWPEKKDTLITI